MSTEAKKLEYNQIAIKDLKTGQLNCYTLKEVSWARDMTLQTQCLGPDHLTINQQELWIARLHESTGLDDTALRSMDRRVFETLLTKWLQINDVDSTAFLETGKKEKSD